MAQRHFKGRQLPCEVRLQFVVGWRKAREWIWVCDNDGSGHIGVRRTIGGLTFKLELRCKERIYAEFLGKGSDVVLSAPLVGGHAK